MFGNPLVDRDNTVFSIRSSLIHDFPSIDFIIADPNGNFPPQGERDLIILDAVKSIPRVMLLDFSDLAHIEKSPVSPHDYDLLLHLLLLKKMGKIDSVKIIGIPYHDYADNNRLLKEISFYIRSLQSIEAAKLRGL